MDDKGNPYSAEKIVNKKMESNKGHNIPQSTCFTKFFDKNNYIINYLENIF